MQELHRPRTFRTCDRLQRPCAKSKEVWPNVLLTRLVHRSDEPTGVGRGAGRPSVSQPRLPLQPDKPAGGGLTIFPAGVVFDRWALHRIAPTSARLPLLDARTTVV
jgi:hypothetical protein